MKFSCCLVHTHIEPGVRQEEASLMLSVIEDLSVQGGAACFARHRLNRRTGFFGVQLLDSIISAHALSSFFQRFFLRYSASEREHKTSMKSHSMAVDLVKMSTSFSLLSDESQSC